MRTAICFVVIIVIFVMVFSSNHTFDTFGTDPENYFRFWTVADKAQKCSPSLVSQTSPEKNMLVKQLEKKIRYKRAISIIYGKFKSVS